jgi:hypothetical protein
MAVESNSGRALILNSFIYLFIREVFTMDNLRISYNIYYCAHWEIKHRYVGRVRVFDDKGNFLYSHSTAIERLTKEDALDDAEKLRNDLSRLTDEV